MSVPSIIFIIIITIIITIIMCPTMIWHSSTGLNAWSPPTRRAPHPWLQSPGGSLTMSCFFFTFGVLFNYVLFFTMFCFIFDILCFFVFYVLFYFWYLVFFVYYVLFFTMWIFLLFVTTMIYFFQGGVPSPKVVWYRDSTMIGGWNSIWFINVIFIWLTLSQRDHHHNHQKAYDHWWSSV